MYAAYFVVNTQAGELVCALDLPALNPARLTFLMSTDQLDITHRHSGVSVRALDLAAVEKDEGATIFADCVATAAILSVKISASDIVTVENALVLTYRSMIKGTASHLHWI